MHAPNAPESKGLERKADAYPKRKILASGIGNKLPTGPSDHLTADRNRTTIAAISLLSATRHRGDSFPLASRATAYPRLGFEHGFLHAALDLLPARLDRIAVGVGRNEDGLGHDAGGGAKGTWHGEPVPASWLAKVS